MKPKKLLSIIFAVTMTITLFAGCGAKNPTSTDTSSTGEKYEVTMAYYANPQKDTERIQTALNKQLEKDKMNFTVKLMPLSWGNYDQQIKLILSGGEPLDLFVTQSSSASTYVNKGVVVDMAPLLAKYGDNITKWVSKDTLNCAKIGDFLYGIPGTRDLALDRSLIIRKDLADKYGIKQENIKSLDDLTNVFEVLKEKEPSMTPAFGLIASNMMSYDSLGDSLGVLMNYGQDTKVVDLYETDEYKHNVNLARDWYTKGYFSKDIATTTEEAGVTMRAGKLASYMLQTKPGYEGQTKMQTGMDVSVLRVVNPYKTTNTTTCFNWSIAKNAKNPEKVMQFFDYAYGSPEFENLINYGEEGIDWKFIDKSKGIINFADGVTAQNSTYNDNIAWEMPNEMVGHVWEGNDPDIWKKLKDFNESALKSKAYGFVFDNTSVTNEITALNNVISKYNKGLETGTVDPNEYLPKFIADLKAAGIDKVVQEKQKQLDGWLAKQK